MDNVDRLSDGDEIVYQEPTDLTELMNEVSDNAADNAGLTDAEIAAKWRRG